MKKIPKITKKELKKIKKSNFNHTNQCSSYMLGGIALGNDRPQNKKVWKCSPDCPLKGME